MKNIFISYSRQDTDIVKPIKKEIESLTNEECWMDVEGISYESSDFADDIARAINDCTVFLFMLSDASQQSRIACGEVELAQKKNKSIFLVNISQCKLTDKFTILYNQHNLCDYSKEAEKDKLVDNICIALKKERPLDTIGKSRQPIKLSKTTRMIYKAVLIAGLIPLLIALAAMISGMLSFKQSDDDFLEIQMMEMQKMEHQPIFSIEYSLTKTEGFEVPDIEDYAISNTGEQMRSLLDMTCETFIKVKYDNISADIHTSAYYPLLGYYGFTKSTGSSVGLLKETVGNESQHNFFYFHNVYKAANAYDDEHPEVIVSVEKVDFFKITYVDIYNEQRTVYYRGAYQKTNLTTKEEYDSVVASATTTYPISKSISEVTVEDLITPLEIK